MLKVKVSSIGNSMGFILPKEALNKLKAQKGDFLFLVEDEEGYRLTPFQPDFAKQMQSAERVIKKYRNTLKELAK